MDAWQLMHTVAHRRDYAEITAAAAQRPEQVDIVLVIGGHDASVRQHHLRREHIVERKSETPDEGAVAAAERESRDADAGDGPRRHNQASGIGYRSDVDCAGAARDRDTAMIGAEHDVSHAAQVNHDTVAECATRPVVAATTNRKRQAVLARGANGGLDVGGEYAVHDGPWRDVDLLRPEAGRGNVAFTSRQGDTRRTSITQTPERVFDRIGNSLTLR